MTWVTITHKSQESTCLFRSVLGSGGGGFCGLVMGHPPLLRNCDLAQPSVYEGHGDTIITGRRPTASQRWCAQETAASQSQMMPSLNSSHLRQLLLLHLFDDTTFTFWSCPEFVWFASHGSRDIIVMFSRLWGISHLNLDSSTHLKHLDCPLTPLPSRPSYPLKDVCFPGSIRKFYY